MEKKRRLPPLRGQILKGILNSMIGWGGSGGGGGGRVTPLNSSSPISSATAPGYASDDVGPSPLNSVIPPLRGQILKGILKSMFGWGGCGGGGGGGGGRVAPLNSSSPNSPATPPGYAYDDVGPTSQLMLELNGDGF